MTLAYPPIISPLAEIHDLFLEQIAHHLMRGHVGTFSSLRRIAKQAGLRITDKDIEAYTKLPWGVADIEWANSRRRSNVKRARHFGLIDHFSTMDLLQVMSRAAGRCEICQAARPLTVEHIVPLSDGGTNTAENIALTCEACNQARDYCGDHYLAGVTDWQGWGSGGHNATP